MLLIRNLRRIKYQTVNYEIIHTLKRVSEPLNFMKERCITIMKLKRFFHQTSLVIILLLCNVAYAQDIKVNFNLIDSFGIAQNKIQLQNVVAEMPSPVDETNPDCDVKYYTQDFGNIFLKACPFKSGKLLYLMPILTIEEPHCGAVKGVNFSNSRSFGGDVNIMYISVDMFEPDLDDFREVVATYKFDPQDLKLTPVFLPSPREVKISLDWGKKPRELDAHLTGPERGRPSSYKNELDRFHLYSGNKDTTNVAILENKPQPVSVEVDEDLNEHQGSTSTAGNEDLNEHQSSTSDDKDLNEHQSSTSTVDDEDLNEHQSSTSTELEENLTKPQTPTTADNEKSSAKPQILTIIPPPKAKTLRPGLYRISVHHYAGNGTIANSEAKVHLQIDDWPKQVFTPPPDYRKKLDGYLDSWTVFELNVTKNGVTVRLPKECYTPLISGPEVP